MKFKSQKVTNKQVFPKTLAQRYDEDTSCKQVDRTKLIKFNKLIQFRQDRKCEQEKFEQISGKKLLDESIRIMSVVPKQELSKFTLKKNDVSPFFKRKNEEIDMRSTHLLIKEARKQEQQRLKET